MAFNFLQPEIVAFIFLCIAVNLPLVSGVRKKRRRRRRKWRRRNTLDPFVIFKIIVEDKEQKLKIPLKLNM